MSRVVPGIGVTMARSLCAAPVEPGSPKSDFVPPELSGITIDEKSGASLPLDLEFADENDNLVHLRDYFHKDRPVVLQLGYFDCPMLCTLVSQGLVDSLNDLTLTMGKDFEVINVSFNPEDNPQRASAKKKSFTEAYNRAAGAESWHFLTGGKRSIREITDAVGFRYKWIESRREFSHPAALILLTPDGRISRYLYGVKYDPRTLRLSLVEASEGKVGTTVDRILLTCFHYDAAAGKYNVTAMNLMRGAGALTVVIIATVITTLIRRELRQRRRPIEGAGDTSVAPT
jgi:protein SCO1/2